MGRHFCILASVYSALFLSVRVNAADEKAAKEKRAAETITARKLIFDYLDNEVAADDNYKGKKVQFTGFVELIGKDLSGTPYVLLSYENSKLVTCVKAYFNPKWNLVSVKKRMTYGARGVCEGYSFGNVVFKQCDFLTKDELEGKPND